jgi:hypothetical protein
VKRNTKCRDKDIEAFLIEMAKIDDLKEKLIHSLQAQEKIYYERLRELGEEAVINML